VCQWTEAWLGDRMRVTRELYWVILLFVELESQTQHVPSGRQRAYSSELIILRTQQQWVEKTRDLQQRIQEAERRPARRE
jgi:hypothetical protein